ncbi:MAG: MopE-related protein [bacterium]
MTVASTRRTPAAARPDAGGLGACAAGSRTCVDKAWPAASARWPPPRSATAWTTTATAGPDEELARHALVRPCYDGPPGDPRRRPVAAASRLARTAPTAPAWARCPGIEICNIADDDCDGAPDEGLGDACLAGPAPRPPLPGRPRDAGGRRLPGGDPDLPAGRRRLRPCRGARLPDVEVCDGADNDCDGRPDEVPGWASPARWAPAPAAPGAADLRPGLGPGPLRCRAGLPEPERCDGLDDAW